MFEEHINVTSDVINNQNRIIRFKESFSIFFKLIQIKTIEINSKDNKEKTPIYPIKPLDSIWVDIKTLYNEITPYARRRK